MTHAGAVDWPWYKFWRVKFLCYMVIGYYAMELAMLLRLTAAVTSLSGFCCTVYCFLAVKMCENPIEQQSAQFMERRTNSASAQSAATPEYIPRVLPHPNS